MLLKKQCLGRLANLEAPEHLVTCISLGDKVIGRHWLMIVDSIVGKPDFYSNQLAGYEPFDAQGEQMKRYMHETVYIDLPQSPSSCFRNI